MCPRIALVAVTILAFVQGYPNQFLLTDYTYSPEKSSTCITVEKRFLKNKPCVFPFKYKGNIYNGCITHNDPDGRSWCSTEVDLNGYHILGRELWGHCGTDCPVDLDGVPISSIEDLPKLGPRLRPFQTSGLSAAALDVVGQGELSTPEPVPVISQPVEEATTEPLRTLTQPLEEAATDDPRSTPALGSIETAVIREIPDDISWFKSEVTGGTWSYNCKFLSEALNKKKLTPSACMQTCQSTGSCTHFTWSRGICSLQGAGQVDPGQAQYTTEPLVCGYFEGPDLEPSVTVLTTVSVPLVETSSGINWLKDSSAIACDFATPSFQSEASERDNCINLCRNFEDCTHYTWIGEPNHTIGICNLKAGLVTKSAAFVTGNSASVCGIRISREEQDNTANRDLFLGLLNVTSTDEAQV